MSTQQLRRGVFTSVPELVETSNAYIARHNQEPKPFIWTAKAIDVPLQSELEFSSN